MGKFRRRQIDGMFLYFVPENRLRHFMQIEMSKPNFWKT